MSDTQVNRRKPKPSLALRFIGLTLVGQLLFGIVLGLGAGTYVAISDHRARTTYVDDVAAAIGASILPLVMDRDLEAAQSQLDGIRMLQDRSGLTGLRLLDGSGRQIAFSGVPEQPCAPTSVPEGIMARLLGPTYIERDIGIGEVRLGTLGLIFGDRTFLEAYGSALLVSALVTAAVVFVSALWFSWLAVRTIIEPVQDIQRAAESLAAGRRNIRLQLVHKDELGLLGDSLEELSRQLHESEEELRQAAVRSEEARVMEARARSEVEQVNRMKSDFVAVAAHEFSTPLAVIKLYSDMLEAGDICELTGEGIEVAEQLKSAAARLSSTVTDLMDVALLERGLMRITLRRFDVSDIVSAAGKDAARLAESRAMEVEVSIEGGKLEVMGDSIRVRQVVDNLLSNAIKYSGPGGSVRISCVADDGHAVIEVADAGPGIPRERKDEVFELFSRLDLDDDRSTAGLGLGLAISARIAEAHDATLRFHQNPEGPGTVFVFRIPLVTEEREAIRSLNVQIVSAEGDEE